MGSLGIPVTSGFFVCGGGFLLIVFVLLLQVTRHYPSHPTKALIICSPAPTPTLTLPRL